MIIKEKKEDWYNGIRIVACLATDDDGSNPEIFWTLYYKDGEMFLTDKNQIDGTPGFQSVSHCFNDAKKNIDSLIRTKSL